MPTSNEIFANKYRPKQFNEVLGNDVIIEALTAKLIKQTLPHTILFSGKPGSGKTTTARILAMALNCTNRPDDQAEPCLECDSCKRALSLKFHPNISEYNCSNQSGIDFARDLEKEGYLGPQGGKAKIYILDECHRLTSDAQSCLLKLLEEGPALTYFFLCTSEPKKLSDALQSRSTIYYFRDASPDDKLDRLKQIRDVEQLPTSDECLMFLLNQDAGMRDTIKYLDMIQDLRQQTPEAIGTLLGIIPQNLINQLIINIINEDAVACFKTLNQLTEYDDQTYSKTYQALVKTYQKICKIKAINDTTNDLHKIASKYPKQLLVKHFRIITQINKISKDQFYCWFELLVISLVAQPDLSFLDID